jgi:hypothetical protein
MLHAGTDFFSSRRYLPPDFLATAQHRRYPSSPDIFLRCRPWALQKCRRRSSSGRVPISLRHALGCVLHRAGRCFPQPPRRSLPASARTVPSRAGPPTRAPLSPMARACPLVGCCSLARRGSLLQLAPSSPRGSHGVLLSAKRLFPTAPSNPVFLCSRGPRPCFPSLAELAGSLSPSSTAGRAQCPPLSSPRAPACSLLGSVTAPCVHLLCARAPSLFLQTSRAPPCVRTELLPYAGLKSLVLAQSGATNRERERNSRVPLRAATSSRSACSGSEAGHPVCSTLPCRKTPTPSSLAAHREVPCCQPPHLS